MSSWEQAAVSSQDEQVQTAGVAKHLQIEADLVAKHVLKRKRNRWQVAFVFVAFAVVFLGAWQLVAALHVIDPIFISSPSKVVVALYQSIQQRTIWLDTWSTFEAAALGLLVGAAIGIPAGVVFHSAPVIRKGLTPYVVMANSLPRPALAPLFILWFGLGLYAKLAVSISLVFFVMLLNTYAGLDGVDADMDKLSRSLGMSRRQRFRLLELPASLPAIIAGLRLSAVYSVLGVVVAEIVAAYAGLGKALTIDTTSLAIADSFAVLFLMTVLAMVLDYAVSLLEKFLTWKGAKA